MNKKNKMLKKITTFFKQLNGYLLILASIKAGIDDFTMNENWDKNATIWQNSYNIFCKE